MRDRKGQSRDVVFGHLRVDVFVYSRGKRVIACAEHWALRSRHSLMWRGTGAGSVNHKAAGDASIDLGGVLRRSFGGVQEIFRWAPDAFRLSTGTHLYYQGSSDKQPDKHKQT
jgi:hypothetical protein